ncbi:methyltransferase domain-containing protein [Spiribacter sp. 2438]|uniref:methyltransferase domain-containing protein n=1 Tax=Spiribacter sp. 2438 TaxID=2666185 RepID=UPI0012B09162|nr:methyltransferase domain-containing protein [Spiribacter sp. 2438]QGM21081.1 methyltransferase domain-containing protein [Spiribacter sp. 2438]
MNTATDDPLRLDSGQLRRRLEQCAPVFDEAAVLHREVARRLVERLDYVRVEPTAVLDLGCATGISASALRQRYPRARHVAMDLGLALVARARRQGRRWRRMPGVCAALDQLPFANDSFDLIFSSLALHRVPDLRATARELQRVLRPEGVLMFATFGPDTLTELRGAWAAVDDTPHVHGFVDMHDIGDALVGARMADPVMDMEHFTLTYADVKSLIDDLTHLGLRNALVSRRRGLTTPRRWAAMEQAYGRLADSEGRLPATWEVAYGHAWGTDAQLQISGDQGEVRVPLDSLSVPRRRRNG